MLNAGLPGLTEGPLQRRDPVEFQSSRMQSIASGIEPGLGGLEVGRGCLHRSQRFECGSLCFPVTTRTRTDDAARHEPLTAPAHLVHGLVVGGRDQNLLPGGFGGGDKVGDELTLSRAGRAGRDGEALGHRRA